MSREKKRFDEYVASQAIDFCNVYGTDIVIKLPLKEIQDKKLSRILAKYVNEQKARIDGDFAYIIPDYDNYQIKPQNYKKRKLLQYVSEKNFLTMINQADMVIEKTQDGKAQYFLKLDQNQVRKYQCVMVMALLIEIGLAQISNQNQCLLIQLNFQQELERTSKIQSDLSHFRTLLGESDNLAAMIDLIERGEINNGKLIISKQKVKDNDMNMEMMSLCDLKIAKLNNENYEMELKFASWLLDFVSNTSDRISFKDMIGE